jgi:starvation-inducible DNA-binding protein
MAGVPSDRDDFTAAERDGCRFGTADRPKVLDGVVPMVDGAAATTCQAVFSARDRQIAHHEGTAQIGELTMIETTIISRSVPGVGPEARSGLVVGLNRQLASLSDLATAYKQAHWNVVGADFSQLHELFDQFADQAREYVDLVAERAVTLGGTARGTIQAAVEHSALPPFPLEERDEIHLLRELVGRIDVVDQDLRAAMDTSADDLATQDVYIEVVRGIEKQRWMLQAHLVRRSSLDRG